MQTTSGPALHTLGNACQHNKYKQRPDDENPLIFYGNWETPGGKRFFCEWYDDCPPCRNQPVSTRVHRQRAQTTCTDDVHRQCVQTTCTDNVHRQSAQTTCTETLGIHTFPHLYSRTSQEFYHRLSIHPVLGTSQRVCPRLSIHPACAHGYLAYCSCTKLVFVKHRPLSKHCQAHGGVLVLYAGTRVDGARVDGAAHSAPE